MTGPSELIGARIRRVDAPSPSLFAFTLSSASWRGVLIALLEAQTRGLGVVATRPQGLPASGFVQKLRRELDGSRIDALSVHEGGRIAFMLQRGPEQKRLVVDLGALDLLVLDADDQVLANLSPRARATPYLLAKAASDADFPQTIEALEALGEALLSQSGDAAFESQRAQLAASIKAARKRTVRRLAAIAGDAARVAQATTLRAHATLLSSNLHRAPRGSRSVTLTDYAQDPPTEVELHLDPAKTAREQAEAWFKQARRFDRGAKLAAERHAQTKIEIEGLERLQEAVVAAADAAALAALEPQFAELRLRMPSTGPREKADKKTRKPYRELRGFRERVILVGRGAKDNDALTLMHARPFDLWLHARDVTGAHVVVPLDRDEACPPELLRDAALLAAHFSDARNEPHLDVIYVPRRYVRKPKGSPAGSVSTEREKVLRLTRDATRLAELLASELSR